MNSQCEQSKLLQIVNLGKQIMKYFGKLISLQIILIILFLIVCITQQYQIKINRRSNICLVFQQNSLNFQAHAQLLKRTDHQYKCMNITPLYHQYKEKKFYFQTIYEQFLPWCDKTKNSYQYINKNTIYEINKGSTVIPWVFRHVQSKDQVLYNMPGIFNPLDYVIISKMIGIQSNLDIVGINPSGSCWGFVTQFHNIINSRYISVGKIDFNNYQIIVSNGDVKLFQYLKSISSSRQKPLRIIIHASKKDLNRLKELSTKQIVRRIAINGCLQFDSVVQTIFKQEGYFEILIKESNRNDIIPSKIPSSNKFLNEIEENYTRFKQSQAKKIQKSLFQYSLNKQKCYCFSNNNITKKSSKQYTYSIYGSLLYEVQQGQLDLWEDQRQPIQWIRSKVKAKDSIYLQLQMNGKSNSILTSVEISSLIPEGNLYLYINPQFKQLVRRIQLQIQRNKITNINILNESSTIKALQSNLIITDNIDIISAVSQQLKNGQRSLLTFITQKDKYSVDLIIRLYSMYHIRKVILPKNPISCIGWEYEHFFFTSHNPQGFYEIQIMENVTYCYWDGEPSTLNGNRLFSFNEMVATMGVEVKLITSKLSYQGFQLSSVPIHKSFRLLTAVHRSDYMRAYLMYNYGGGYSDIKHNHFDWRPYFQMLQKNKETKWAIGYAEKKQDDVGCNNEHGQPKCNVISSYYYNLLGNGKYIHIRHSPIVVEWFSLINTNLDNKYQILLENPPRSPNYDANGWKMIDPKTKDQYISKYPFRWPGVSGEFFSRACYKYMGSYFKNLPYVITTDYRN